MAKDLNRIKVERKNQKIISVVTENNQRFFAFLQ